MLQKIWGKRGFPRVPYTERFLAALGICTGTSYPTILQHRAFTNGITKIMPEQWKKCQLEKYLLCAAKL